MPSIPAILAPPMEIRFSAQSLLALLFHGTGKTTKAKGNTVSIADRLVFDLFEHVGNERASAEKFISEHYADYFGASVEAFMPRLFSLRDQNGSICGAFGLRAGTHKLFLEQYLDTPIEKAISVRTSSKVERHVVVEVGHFSGTFPGAVRAMISLLTERLYREGYEWVTFTGTTSLRNAFSRMGLSPIDILAAEAERLPAAERVGWGSYYDYAPHILVGNIKEGYRALAHRTLASMA